MENHHHNGIDNFRIDPKDLLGFPILDTTPTYKAEEGTQVYVLQDGIKYLYAMIDREWTLMTRASSGITNSGTLNFGAILPHASADLTLALVGSLNADAVILGVDNGVFGGTNCGNISFFCWVSAPGTITIRCTNHDAVNTANPASGTFTVTVIQF